MSELAHPPAAIVRAHFIEKEMCTPEGNGKWPSWIRSLPDMPTEAISFHDTTPIRLGRMMEGETVEKFGHMIQIRAAEYPTAWARGYMLRLFLDKVFEADVVIGNTRYRIQSLRYLNLSPLGPDDKKRELFTLNFTSTLRAL